MLVVVVVASNTRYEVAHPRDYMRLDKIRAERLTALSWTSALGVSSELHVRLDKRRRLIRDGTS